MSDADADAEGEVDPDYIPSDGDVAELLPLTPVETPSVSAQEPDDRDDPSAAKDVQIDEPNAELDAEPIQEGTGISPLTPSADARWVIIFTFVSCD